MLTCLPRSEGRGPIEARAPRATRPSVGVVSHGQKAVDPLKLVPPPDAELARGPVSHGQKAVDPLKHEPLQPRRPRHEGLPRSEGRGPIEASKENTRGAMSSGSPTVRRPWTH